MLITVVCFRRTGASCQAAARGGSLLVERTSYSEAARSTACVDAVALRQFESGDRRQDSAPDSLQAAVPALGAVEILWMSLSCLAHFISNQRSGD
jgi:hypothetical protein